MILKIDPSMFVGMSLNDAQTTIQGYSYSSRVTMVDGRPLIVSRDYDPLRINLEVENNIVTAAKIG